MAKLQCARLMKFIIPSVTDSPTESRNSSMPYASPSNSRPASGAIIVSVALAAPLFLQPRFDRILDVLDRVDLDVEQLAAGALHAPDVDVLDDVARLRIDRDRSARAFPLHSFGRRDQ